MVHSRGNVTTAAWFWEGTYHALSFTPSRVTSVDLLVRPTEVGRALTAVRGRSVATIAMLTGSTTQ